LSTTIAPGIGEVRGQGCPHGVDAGDELDVELGVSVLELEIDEVVVEEFGTDRVVVGARLIDGVGVVPGRVVSLDASVIVEVGPLRLEHPLETLEA
jgi:hypothetical protein